MTKASLDDLHDELYVLACAVEDVERDLAAAGEAPSEDELRRALDWFLDAARPLPRPGDRRTDHPGHHSVMTE